MLCHECKERPATIHLTQIVANKVTRQDYCALCGQKHVEWAAESASVKRSPVSKPPTLESREQMLARIIAADSRYASEVYWFVRFGCIKAMARRLSDPHTETPGNISSVELLAELRELALRKFDKEAKARLNGWGVFKCEDFGEIIFNLIQAGLVDRLQQENKADFQGGYDFDDVFLS